MINNNEHFFENHQLYILKICIEVLFLIKREEEAEKLNLVSFFAAILIGSVISF